MGKFSTGFWKTGWRERVCREKFSTGFWEMACLGKICLTGFRKIIFYNYTSTHPPPSGGGEPYGGTKLQKAALRAAFCRLASCQVA